ncbi:MAG: SoxR reducing system RseC family protein [Candidatus Omnitrophica bacterium]|nr:SoxR reducing system RseC family protein [Candidatus Omnitrophota bacterium]MCF7877446.1 SoxR reducing system RseC family protein [Candidatus Omnitrophota bacterium]MCF7878051.1 SoxR reducing system RseC family protein [Candidatus Omnitrophota bacterium]MCF7892732.1 SoxR reducing system RseC family protein [Candidatus Omnitrophota bacterium]
MHKETATVKKVLKDKILIKVDKKAMCGCCRITSACNKNQGIFELPNNNLYLNEGNKIEVGVEAGKAISAISIMFIIPLAIFVMALVLLQNRGELISFLLALSIMFIYYGVVKIFIKNTNKFNIKFLRKLKDED